MVAPSLEIVGGQAVQASRLLELLSQAPGIRMSFQPINPSLPRPLRWLRSIPYVRTVVNGLFYWAQLFSRAWRYDILHVFTAGLSSYHLWTVPAIYAGRIYRKKVVVNYRDGRAEDHLTRYPRARRSLRKADRVITPSGYLVDVFRRFGIAAQPIVNVIDASRFHYRERSRLRPVFLTNRGLEPLYNVECVLRAFSRIQVRYPDAELIIAHDGPCRASLEHLAADLKLRNARFLGEVAPGKMPELYDQCDIYLMTPNIDNMPGTLLECMVSGVPIVATKAGGIPYVVRDRDTALLVDLDDDAGVARCAFELLENPDLVERLTRAARAEAGRYEGNSVRDAWVDLYRELSAS